MRKLSPTLFLCLLLVCTMVGGAFASWQYTGGAAPLSLNADSSLGNFSYGTLYITDVSVVGGAYSTAAAEKSGETNIRADLTLDNNLASNVTVNVTFYNSTDVSYYYSDTETVTSNNTSIGYAVSNIEKREEIPAKTYKTLSVTFRYSGTSAANGALSSELHFKFSVDKESIGVVVAQTAVTRFADIINNVVAPDSYATLENAMNNRGWDSSSVSFVGNVSGADDEDSALIQQLFTNEFLNMDLDGDGKSEPITLMIKRENLDGNVQTGDDYTYRGLFGNSQTVRGVEMTIYITSEGFDSNTLTVYAATFTILPGGDKWTEIVPLTKGTATANRYSFGFGGNNSFNTDTWKSESGETMDTLAVRAMEGLN